MGRSIWRPPFEPTAELVVSHKGLLFGGRRFRPGEPFKEQTTVRAKRNLYEMRHLDMVPHENTPPAANDAVLPLEDRALLTLIAPAGAELSKLSAEDNAVLALLAPERVDEPFTIPATVLQGLATNAQQPATGGPRTVVPLGRGWYDVHDAQGNVVNTKRLHLKEAEALAAQG